VPTRRGKPTYTGRQDREHDHALAAHTTKTHPAQVKNTPPHAARVRFAATTADN